MARFNAKQISLRLSFGEILKSARQEQGLSLKQVSWKLKIPAPYLEALEEEMFHQLPAGSYGRHFIKEYAKCLKLNVAAVINEYDERLAYWHKYTDTKSHLPKVKSAGWFTSRWALLGGILLALLIYLGYGAIQLFLKPSLEIYYPPVNFVTSNLEITVTGLTKPGTVVTINGENVVVNNDGQFSQVVTLQPGINIINFLAHRAYSGDVILSREVLVSTLPQSTIP